MLKMLLVMRGNILWASDEVIPLPDGFVIVFFDRWIIFRMIRGTGSQFLATISRGVKRGPERFVCTTVGRRCR